MGLSQPRPSGSIILARGRICQILQVTTKQVLDNILPRPTNRFQCAALSEQTNRVSGATAYRETTKITHFWLKRAIGRFNVEVAIAVEHPGHSELLKPQWGATTLTSTATTHHGAPSRRNCTNAALADSLITGNPN